MAISGSATMVEMIETYQLDKLDNIPDARFEELFKKFGGLTIKEHLIREGKCHGIDFKWWNVHLKSMLCERFYAEIMTRDTMPLFREFRDMNLELCRNGKYLNKEKEWWNSQLQEFIGPDITAFLSQVTNMGPRATNKRRRIE